MTIVTIVTAWLHSYCYYCFLKLHSIIIIQWPRRTLAATGDRHRSRVWWNFNFEHVDIVSCIVLILYYIIKFYYDVAVLLATMLITRSGKYPSRPPYYYTSYFILMLLFPSSFGLYSVWISSSPISNFSSALAV